MVRRLPGPVSLTYGGKANAFHPSKDPGRPGRTLRVQRAPGSRPAPVRSLAARQFRRHELKSNLVLVDIERFIMERAMAARPRSAHRDPAGAGRPGARRPRHQYRNLAQQRCRPLGPRPEDRQGQRVGELYMGGEAWFVPRYTAERLPELKSAADLPVQDRFKGPRGARQGRFYGCPAGWGCE